MLGPEQLGCPRRFGSGKVSGPGRFESEKVRGGLSSEEVSGLMRPQLRGGSRRSEGVSGPRRCCSPG